MSTRAKVLTWQRRLGSIGIAPDDDDTVRLQKASLTLASIVITVLAVLWVGTYLALGLITAAAIPFTYQVVSIATIAMFARTKNYRAFRFSQAAMMSVLPFLLQWDLGGYAASSAVSLWALIAAIGTLFFFTADESIPWFVLFVVLSFVSGVLDPVLAQHAAAIPDPVRTAFFVFNVTGVSVTAYLMLQAAVRARDDAYTRSETLLLNVLPRPIAERLKREPGVIAEAYPDVGVLFADVVDFTPFAERTSPERLVAALDSIFSAFDALAARHGIEKIKTIGDAYMCASGLPTPRPGHLEAMADMALEMQSEMRRLSAQLDLALQIRIGMEAGPVVAGVIGRHKFIYDLWGDTVNTASRLETHGVPGGIQTSQAVRDRLSDAYRFEARGQIELKGKGLRSAWLLTGRVGEQRSLPGVGAEELAVSA